MPIFHNQKIIFLHIPKNAGTSIEKYLFQKENIELNSYFISKEYLFECLKDGLETSLQHLTLSQIIPKFDFEAIKDYKVYYVVRDPFQRMVSEYIFLKYVYYLYIHHPEFTCVFKYIDKISDFEHYYLKDSLSRENFNQFIKFYFQTKYTFDNHKLPQNEFIKGIKIFYPNAYELRYELLEEDFEKYFNEKLSFRDNAVDKLDDFKFSRDYNDYYSYESMNLIYEYYKEDFKKFGYNQDYYERKGFITGVMFYKLKKYQETIGDIIYYIDNSKNSNPKILLNYLKNKLQEEIV